MAKANTLASLTRLDEGLATLKAVLELAPNYAPGHLSRGYILEAKDQPGEARAAFQAALEFAADGAQRREAREALTTLNAQGMSTQP